MWHPRGLHREYDRHEDIWLALKKGKRPGTDPRQCNRDGRLTTEACLCTWLTGLSDGEKYGLISQAASDAPLCLEGLEAVLQLGWYDMNVYIQTSTGIRHVLAGRPRALQPRQTQREQRVLHALVAARERAEQLHPFSSHMSRATLYAGKLVWCNGTGASGALEGVKLPVQTAVGLPLRSHVGGGAAFWAARISSSLGGSGGT